MSMRGVPSASQSTRRPSPASAARRAERLASPISPSSSVSSAGASWGTSPSSPISQAAVSSEENPTRGRQLHQPQQNSHHTPLLSPFGLSRLQLSPRLRHLADNFNRLYGAQQPEPQTQRDEAQVVRRLAGDFNRRYAQQGQPQPQRNGRHLSPELQRLAGDFNRLYGGQGQSQPQQQRNGRLSSDELSELQQLVGSLIRDRQQNHRHTPPPSPAGSQVSLHGSHPPALPTPIQRFFNSLKPPDDKSKDIT